MTDRIRKPLSIGVFIIILLVGSLCLPNMVNTVVREYDLDDDEPCTIVGKMEVDGVHILLFRSDDGGCDNLPTMSDAEHSVVFDKTSIVSEGVYDQHDIGECLTGREVKDAFELPTPDAIKNERLQGVIIGLVFISIVGVYVAAMVWLGI